ncbi:type II toxin-antitoxin system RelE/ParE family toxin [Neorhizobium sp. P12A]|uniref:type II toxin-antitoxin system RelE/ParE family toxin n=1 Tax=Rhizobium/Agrobacterium group TaxID=227290 RepID=UPI00104835E3|nr:MULTISPECIES: type II toxin-antitoxin system RelE/ParE family toxin [Rhizobium/Agrobacterium group]KAA0689404.1 type II toxin-antitoxin system RelE/ParE family toxin [Neorhizobium sp. P12A]TCR69299.1 plasmid stabilization system protein ParE [Rhizobium sp. BK376]
MNRYHIRLTPEAELDLLHIYRFVRKKAASNTVARSYIARIRAFMEEFEAFPQRGTTRDHIRPGLRIVGFERRVSIAFVVEPTEVVILRVLYAGQEFEGG